MVKQFKFIFLSIIMVGLSHFTHAESTLVENEKVINDSLPNTANSPYITTPNDNETAPAEDSTFEDNNDEKFVNPFTGLPESKDDYQEADSNDPSSEQVRKKDTFTNPFTGNVESKDDYKDKPVVDDPLAEPKPQDGTILNPFTGMEEPKADYKEPPQETDNMDKNSEKQGFNPFTGTVEPKDKEDNNNSDPMLGNPAGDSDNPYYQPLPDSL